MSPPAVVIRFDLEAGPLVFADYLTEAEERRMADWLNAHPEYRALIDDAVELAEQERRAA